MSSGDVEVIERWLAAFNAGDRDTALKGLAPDAALYPPAERLTGGPDVYHGPEGWLEYHALLDEMLEDIRYEPEAFLEVADGLVVVDVKVSGVGRGSGVPWEQPVGHVYELRDGRVASLRVFMDRAQARDAVADRG